MASFSVKIQYTSRLWFLYLLLTSAAKVCGFYVPGVAPVEFKEADAIEVKAVKMTSSKTQLPYEYYSLPLCKPEGELQYKSENLGEVLRGDRIVNTPFKIQMDANKGCEVLCNKPNTPVTWDEKQSKLVGERIKHEYYVHLLIDNLPCATKYTMLDNPQEIQYEHGYRLGFVKADGKVYIHNHLSFQLKYHYDGTTKTYRVVGFEIEPKSIKNGELQVDGGASALNWTKIILRRKSQ